MFLGTCPPAADECQFPQAESPGVRCWISFGGNVGDVKATFDAALALLSLHCHIRLGQRSGIYSTQPMGSCSGKPFLNSVCELTTQLDPQCLLGVLQCVENQLGRVRDIRWGPRTLDLDILSYGDRLIDEPDLVVPHPALTYRRFVLDPLVEIASEWKHPAYSISAGELAGRLTTRPLRVSLLDVTPMQIDKLASQLRARFADLELLSSPDCDESVLPIRTTANSTDCREAIVDLSRSPGDLLEQLTSALTAVFDSPQRISDW